MIFIVWRKWRLARLLFLLFSSNYKWVLLFKFKSVHHRTIQINHQPDATIIQFIILTFIFSSTCFGRFPAQELNDCGGSLWFFLRIVVTVVPCSWSGQPARQRTRHDCHHDTKIKPEAATGVIELLGRKTPETCWAVNKRQDNKLENCCIWLVIYLSITLYMLIWYKRYLNDNSEWKFGEYMFLGLLVFRGDRKLTEAWAGQISGWIKGYMKI
jgi:hypothetical protein